ncbi:hypothetical protein ANN_00859 [Periplaneta americana]|uniref:THAP-type domain-containing protein n=1 Tax=Periplaneta americana TaxID=6978 RepID=A0ABQ8TW00_PERAM|nr:hypothetical protein ANN_00859 [Periplaneta americana]
MAGLCESCNEPAGSLKAICNWLFNDAVSTTRLFSVDEIGDSEMIFGEISRGFAIDYLAFNLRLGKTSEKSQPARICSLHFEESSYEVPLKQKLLNYEPKSSRNLKVDAVPTKALSQSCLKRKSTDNLRLDRCEKRRRRKEIHDIIAK